LVPTETVFPHSFFEARRNGETSSVDRLLRERSVDLNTLVDDNGDIPLAIAVGAKGEGVATAMCKRLLRLGASPHAQMLGTGRTPLMEMVPLLIFKRDVAHLLPSSVNKQDNDGRTALMFAVDDE
jgi:ankyrin repeat protein